MGPDPGETPTSAGAATVTVGAVVSRTSTVTVFCAVTPKPLVTVWVMLVAPCGKTYVARVMGSLVAAR
jgi:hypothetical protein